jgi:hypothetical protein
MKKTTLIILAGILTSICCCYIWRSSQKTVPLTTRIECANDTALYVDPSTDRSSIAFILGEDKEADNPYFREAVRYYTTNPEAKTDFIVSTFRSLVEVKDYLEQNTPCNGLPWGTIHLVTHGNQWSGLSVRVVRGEKRATTKRILEHMQSNPFEPLNEAHVDNETRIFLHGCGVGNDGDLVDAIALFFKGKNGQPVVVASKMFEYYASTGSEQNLQSQRYMARGWLVSYPMGDKPSFTALTNELREKFSDTRVDWQLALSQEQPRWIGDVYHYTFEVPVRWVIPVDAAPRLPKENQQHAWLQTQQQIVDHLKVLQIPIENFKWSITSGYTLTKAGLPSRAVTVKGYCTMLCVLQVLTDDHDNGLILQKPLTSDFNDMRFYYSTGQTKLTGI